MASCCKKVQNAAKNDRLTASLCAKQAPVPKPAAVSSSAARILSGTKLTALYHVGQLAGVLSAAQKDELFKRAGLQQVADCRT